MKTVGDRAVSALAARCPRLESLSLYWNPQLRDAALAALTAHRAGTLRALNLSGCKGVTDAGVAGLALCAQLRDLDLTRCVQATDGGVMPVVLGCPQLTRLVLYADGQLTARSGERARAHARVWRSGEQRGCLWSGSACC